MSGFSKVLIAAGVFLVVLGILVNFGLGRLPGDIYLKKENFTFYFPLTSAIAVSLIISVLVYIVKR